MPNEISPENEQFIEQQIAKGSFRDRREALDAGVDLLKERRRLIDRLKESREQLNTGDFTEYDQQGLRCLFDELKERARRRAEADQHGG